MATVGEPTDGEARSECEGLPWKYRVQQARYSPGIARCFIWGTNFRKALFTFFTNFHSLSLRFGRPIWKKLRLLKWVDTLVHPWGHGDGDGWTRWTGTDSWSWGCWGETDWNYWPLLGEICHCYWGSLAAFSVRGLELMGWRHVVSESKSHHKSSRLPEGSRFRLQGGDSNRASPMWNLHLSSLYNPILNLDPCFSIFLIHFMCLACTYFSAKKQVVEQSWQHLLLPRNQSLHFSRIPINGAFKSFFRVHL